MKENSIFENYLNLIMTSWVMILMMRIVECGAMLINFGNENGMLLSELAGFGIDFVCANLVLTVLFPIYLALSKCSCKMADTVCLTVFVLLEIVHLLVLQYFFNQHKPLGSLLFGYSLDEIMLTVTTANVSVTKVVLLMAGLIILSLTSFFVIKKINAKNKAKAKIVTLASLPVAVILIVFASRYYNDFTVNKSLAFYKAAVEYKTEEKVYCHEISDAEIEEYHQMFQEKKFVSNEFPLLHKYETADSLGFYFNEFESKPNIVILFVEGLNDDFVHDYHGANLMPNLRKIMEKSLYWNHCFTLGERSFAVVPSVLGSLPYGEIGFTLLDQLPLHLTLTSVLEANGYQTDFFYGQGSWFHKKNIFFRKNNIDLIFDNAKYSDKYEKIVVGKENYFWGYNDKCLFEQSLEVIDTLGDSPRLDMYFTGSTHSPFIISETEKYDGRLDEICENLENGTDRKFFKHYGIYARTLLFLDDALGDFIGSYSKRNDFQNTIFVITGDHPMCEIAPENSLKRYHVPFIVYSPNLKTSATFSNIVSHLDFYETMIAFMEKYGVEKPDFSASFGGNMFAESNNIAFMDEPRNVIDFYSDGHYISGKDLYEVENDFNIRKINDKDLYETLRHRLEIVRKISEYTSLENKIMPAEIYCKALNDTLLRKFKSDGDIVFSGQYQNVLTEVDVTAFDTLVLDFSLDYHGVDDVCQLVYKITDENGANISTEYMGLGKDGRKFAYHRRIPLCGKGEKTFFNAFFYNPKQQRCTISKLDGILLGNIE
ncbi:MAG: LTA synthase family protein [Bacteroidales bacterium]|nr:LTA synthase family protein [Bacteroidales bacterium]